MANIKLIIEYDGTDFAGWQVQPGLRTVQGEVEKALAEITSQPVRIIGASRTDAGVHAWNQTANFHIEKEFKNDIFFKGLNGLLPKDIRIKSAEYAEDSFHSRFSARQRFYRYRLSKTNRAIGRQYLWVYPFPFDLELVRQETEIII